MRKAALLAALALAACQAHPPDAVVEVRNPPPAPAAVPSPAPPGNPAADGYLAVAVARRSVEVTAELDGELRSLDVAVGDPVSPGTRLATIETREISEQLASAKAALTALEAEHKRTQIELESVKNQYERRAAYKELYPREQLDELLSQEKADAAAVETAAARVAEERGHVAQLSNRLSHAVLTSPIRGTVATRYLDPGAIVHSGTPIVRLISAGTYVVRFAVPPDQSARLKVGERVGFRPESHDPELPGVISQIAPQVDTASQMVFAEADLGDLSQQGAPGRLRDGLVGTVRVTAR